MGQSQLFLGNVVAINNVWLVSTWNMTRLKYGVTKDVQYFINILLLYIAMVFWIYWVKLNTLLICDSHFISVEGADLEWKHYLYLPLTYYVAIWLFPVLLYSNCFCSSPKEFQRTYFSICSMWHYSLHFSIMYFTY